MVTTTGVRMAEIAAAVGDLRKTRGRCNGPVSKDVALCGNDAHESVKTVPTCSAMPRKPKPPKCEDCYFRKNTLCALDLESPCTTFRPDRPEGLVPPRQPVLLMRPPRWATQSQVA